MPTIVVRLALAVAAVLVPFAAARPAAAVTSPRTVLPDGTIRYDYGRRPLPTLACRPHFVCDIALDGGEAVLNLAIGDAAHWVIASGQSGPGGATPHVFVKPTQPGLETNLLITTSKRSYDIALRAQADAAPARISFFYPDEDAAAKAASAERERAAIDAVLAGTPAVAADAADTRYDVSGDPALLPDRVFNDGTRTFVQWKALPSELPAVVAVAKDGSRAAVNFRVVGAQYVIDGLGPAYDLVTGAGRGRAERRASIRHR